MNNYHIDNEELIQLWPDREPVQKIMEHIYNPEVVVMPDIAEELEEIVLQALLTYKTRTGEICYVSEE